MYLLDYYNTPTSSINTDLYLVGMNIRHVKVDTIFPTGGGPSGSEPVHLLAGERVGMIHT
jgi:hypothetical protein